MPPITSIPRELCDQRSGAAARAAGDSSGFRVIWLLATRRYRPCAVAINAPLGPARPCAAAKALLVIGIIAGGLLVDQKIAFWGQALTNIAVWALFLYWLRRAGSREQVALAACVVYATLGEIFLSLIWGLYEYRLANIPLFVPPGHALLFILGSFIAARIPDRIIGFVPLAATPAVGILQWSGLDTFGPLLFVLFLACVLIGRARKLYAVMFVLSLAMEIYGTWLGNWRWQATVPWLGLTTVNPPLAAGAFYCVLDMLVVATVNSRWIYAVRSAPTAAPAATLWARNARTAADT